MSSLQRRKKFDPKMDRGKKTRLKTSVQNQLQNFNVDFQLVDLIMAIAQNVARPIFVTINA
jgi:hypothetical protein